MIKDITTIAHNYQQLLLIFSYATSFQIHCCQSVLLGLINKLNFNNCKKFRIKGKYIYIYICLFLLQIIYKRPILLSLQVYVRSFYWLTLKKNDCTYKICFLI